MYYLFYVWLSKGIYKKKKKKKKMLTDSQMWWGMSFLEVCFLVLSPKSVSSCNVCPQEMTVKGLEPEIQRLIAKHKAEVKKIKSIHEAELLESDERAGQRYITMTEELRDQLSKEKETACARERELARQT